MDVLSTLKEREAERPARLLKLARRVAGLDGPPPTAADCEKTLRDCGATVADLESGVGILRERIAAAAELDAAKAAQERAGELRQIIGEADAELARARAAYEARTRGPLEELRAIELMGGDARAKQTLLTRIPPGDERLARRLAAERKAADAEHRRREAQAEIEKRENEITRLRQRIAELEGRIPLSVDVIHSCRTDVKRLEGEIEELTRRGAVLQDEAASAVAEAARVAAELMAP